MTITDLVGLTAVVIPSDRTELMNTMTHLPPREWTQLAADTALRNGTIEIRIDPAYHDVVEERRGLLYRVRLLAIENDHWIIERPFSLQGKPSVQAGMKLIGILGTAASRWSFCTDARSAGLYQLNSESKVPVMHLTLPSHVQSAQRRAYYRVAMLGEQKARARVWPLLDVESARFAELANSTLHKSNGRSDSTIAAHPTVGTGCEGWVLDFSAGGLAIGIDQDLRLPLKQYETFWIEMSLPTLKWPLCTTARLVRTFDESSEMSRLAYEFSFEHNPTHEKFVLDTLCRVAAAEQRRQIQRSRQTA